MRMLMNSLDPEIAERPEELIVGGGARRVARNWATFHGIVESLRALGNEETLLVRSGEASGAIRTDERAPRVLILNSGLIERAPDRKALDDPERLALMLDRRVSAGGWTYTGTQEALAVACETFSAAAKTHFGGDLAGKIVISGGMGASGGAQPLAAALHGAVFLGVEVDAEKIKRRIRTGYCDICVNELDEALRILKNAVRKQEAVSVGLIGNAAEILPELARRGVVPDLLTDQTGAHDPLHGYVPIGLTLAEAAELRRENPGDYRIRANESIARHVTAMLELQKLGANVFEFGNSIRATAFERGVRKAFDFPGFVEAYLRPFFSEGRWPLRWVALSGDPADIRRTDDLILELFHQNATLTRWIRLAREQVRSQGLPARSAWLARRERLLFAERLNDLVVKGEVKAPFVIACESLVGEPLASSLRKSQKSKVESDIIAGGSLLNAQVKSASGASWASYESAGGGTETIGIASRAVLMDGSAEGRRRIGQVFSNAGEV